jgi:urea transport system substrate-binding protein
MRFGMRRRSLLFVAVTAALVATASVLAATALAAPRATTVKIGFVQTASGAQSTNSQLASQAVAAAVAYVNKVNLAGAKIQIVSADDAADPRTAADACNRLVNQDGVKVVIGFESTPARAACDPFLTAKNIPYIAGQPSAGDFCPANMFLVGTIPNQQDGPLVNYLYKKGHRSVYFVGSDFSSGHTTATLLDKLLKAKSGASLAGTSFEPFGTSDWSAEIAKIAASGADTIFDTIIGNDDISFWKQVANDPRVSKLARVDPLLSTAQVSALGSDATGIYSSNSWIQTLKTKGNALYLQWLTKKFGTKALPDPQGAHLWDAVLVAATAIKKAGSTDGAKLTSTIASLKLTGAGGIVTYQPKNKGFLVLPVFISQVGSDGSFKLVAGYSHVYPLPSC